MIDSFTDTLGENLANILTITAIALVVLTTTWYVLARRRRVSQLRSRVRGEVPVSGAVKEALGKVFNVDSLEAATLGTVTFVDIAWHYSMADPSIWDHFHGPAADHIADAIQNLDVLKGSLGDASLPLAEKVIEYFKGLEATQLFHDLADKLGVLDSGDTGAVVLDAKTGSMVDALVQHAGTTLDVKSAVIGKAVGLLVHIPMITIGFATYRAWRRSQKGTGLRRNVEFAAIEVATRAGGSLAGGQIGGAIGTAIAPGAGTIIGSVAGAIAGAVGGKWLGEELKARHVRTAQERLNTSLEALGRPYLAEPDRFRALREVFVDQERHYIENVHATRRRMTRYALLPWRVVWPDEKLVLLQETVRMAEDRLAEVKQGTLEAVERLDFMRQTAQYRQMGIILWSDAALGQRVIEGEELVTDVAEANNTLRHELTQLGWQPQVAAAMN